MANFFRVPFGSSGDRDDVPVDAQVDGSVSFELGYPPLYEADQDTDPAALDIERQKMNTLFYLMTDAIREWQVQSVPNWITSADNGGTAYAYPKYARVRYNDAVYESLVMSNTANPSDASKWLPVNLLQYAPINNATLTGTTNAEAMNVAGSAVQTLANFTGANQSLSTDTDTQKSQKIPGGLTIKVGRVYARDDFWVKVTFDTPFANACFGVLGVAEANGPSGTATANSANTGQITKTDFYIGTQGVIGGPVTGYVFWLAIGY